MWFRVALNSAPECWHHRSEYRLKWAAPWKDWKAVLRVMCTICVREPALVLGGPQSHKSCSYRWMLATMWVGADTGSSARAANAVNCQAISQTPKQMFFKTSLSLGVGGVHMSQCIDGVRRTLVSINQFFPSKRQIPRSELRVSICTAIVFTR